MAETKKMLYAFRKSNSLCVRCGNDNNNGKVLCDTCREADKQYKKIRYISKKDKKLCIKCEKPIRSNAVCCSDCRKKENNRQKKEIRAKRKAQGLCIRCGQANNSGYVTCDTCRSYLAELKKAYSDSGICTVCGQEYAVLNCKMCASCSEKSRKASQKYYYTNSQYIQRKARNSRKQKYNQRKNEKICVSCGKRKAYLWYARCAYCLENDKQNARRYRERMSFNQECANI